MNWIYIAHPYGGLEENKIKVGQIIKGLAKENPDILYISPIHATGFLYDDVSYEQGMEYCFELLNCCEAYMLS